MLCKFCRNLTKLAKTTKMPPELKHQKRYRATFKRQLPFYSLLSITVCYFICSIDKKRIKPQDINHNTPGFKTSGFKTSGFKTSETSGLQNVRFTKCQVYKMSGLQNVRSSKRLVTKKKTSKYILYLWLVEIRRFCCSHVCRHRDGRVLFSILEGFFATYHHNG
jgi:hypothetical protein